MQPVGHVSVTEAQQNLRTAELRRVPLGDNTVHCRMQSLEETDMVVQLPWERTNLAPGTLQDPAPGTRSLKGHSSQRPRHSVTALLGEATSWSRSGSGMRVADVEKKVNLALPFQETSLVAGKQFLPRFLIGLASAQLTQDEQEHSSVCSSAKGAILIQVGRSVNATVSAHSAPLHSDVWKFHEDSGMGHAFSVISLCNVSFHNFLSPNGYFKWEWTDCEPQATYVDIIMLNRKSQCH